jgi:hypothetical protein
MKDTRSGPWLILSSLSMNIPPGAGTARPRLSISHQGSWPLGSSKRNRPLSMNPTTDQWQGPHVAVQLRASVVSRQWLVFRRQEFSPAARRERRAFPSGGGQEQATTREAKKTAAQWVALNLVWGLGSRSKIPADKGFPSPAHQFIQTHLSATAKNRPEKGLKKPQIGVVFSVSLCTKTSCSGDSRPS